jgi:hypothetical protein
MNKLSVEPEYVTKSRIAKTGCTPSDDLKHGLGVGNRA